MASTRKSGNTERIGDLINPADIPELLKVPDRKARRGLQHMLGCRTCGVEAAEFDVTGNQKGVQ